MLAFAITSIAPVATLAGAGAADEGAVAGPQAVQTSADILRTFLGNETLLWGCMAMAMIALFTVAKVASRRRKAGKASRLARAQADAVHGFLNAVREGHGTARQGMWHFDFSTGNQQYSDNLRALISGCGKKPPCDKEIDKTLQEAGLNLAKLAYDHFEQTLPFEAAFTLNPGNAAARQMTLRACNFRGKNGKVQRVVAIISEVPEPTGE